MISWIRLNATILPSDPEEYVRPEGGLVFRVWGKLIGERRDEARIGSITIQESIVDVCGISSL